MISPNGKRLSLMISILSIISSVMISPNKKVIIDNPKCAITTACTRDPVVQRSYLDSAQGYGFMISPCPPREPQMKGRVESGVKYVKHSFLGFPRCEYNLKYKRVT